MLDEKYKLKINKYGDVKGIPDGWVRIPTDNAEIYDGENIPIYRANIGFSKKRGKYIPRSVNITHEDYREEVQQIYEEECIKDTNYASHALSDRKLIVEALCAINNEAKRQRDFMEAAHDKEYGNGNKGCMNRAKNISTKRGYYNARKKKQELYALKDKAIRQMISEWGLKSLGYHVMPGGKKRGYIEVEGYGFHMASIRSKKKLGELTNKVAASCSKCGCMQTRRAVKVIEAFIVKGCTDPSDHGFAHELS